MERGGKKEKYVPRGNDLANGILSPLTEENFEVKASWWLTAFKRVRLKIQAKKITSNIWNGKREPDKLLKSLRIRNIYESAR